MFVGLRPQIPNLHFKGVLLIIWKMLKLLAVDPLTDFGVNHMHFLISTPLYLSIVLEGPLDINIL